MRYERSQQNLSRMMAFVVSLTEPSVPMVVSFSNACTDCWKVRQAMDLASIRYCSEQCEIIRKPSGHGEE